MSIMELGHRGPEFQSVAASTENDLRSLMAIPSNYQVLFLSGGASAQFAMVPLNLFSKNNRANYIDTGIWSKKAINEAKRYGEVNVAASIDEQDGLICIPREKEWKLAEGACYLHYTPNETIEGIEFNFIPSTSAPLVVDMSSMILSQPIDVSRYGIIYAGAQKNLGQAGITVVIIRDDLIGQPMPFTPTLYQYKVMSENHSFYNTPPTYSWYITGLVLEWVKMKGGVSSLYEINRRKSKKLYSAIDNSNGFYSNHIHPESLLMTNVVFTLRDEKLILYFCKKQNMRVLPIYEVTVWSWLAC